MIMFSVVHCHLLPSVRITWFWSWFIDRMLVLELVQMGMALENVQKLNQNFVLCTIWTVWENNCKLVEISTNL